MDWWLLLLRVIHIGSAMTWFGGAIIGSFFLAPTAQALGPAGQPFMDQLMNRRKMGIFFPIVAALTVLSGAALYWRASAGLQLTWITSPSGLAFTVGGLAAIISSSPALSSWGPAWPSKRPSETSWPKGKACRLMYSWRDWRVRIA